MDQVRDSHCTHTTLLMVHRTVQPLVFTSHDTQNMGAELPCVLVRVQVRTSGNAATATV